MSNNSQADEFHNYIKLRDAGQSAKDVYLQAKADDLSTIGCIRMLEYVFNLSLVQAKEVMVIGDGLGSSLADYEEKVITGLHNIVKLEEDTQEAPRQDE